MRFDKPVPRIGTYSNKAPKGSTIVMGSMSRVQGDIDPTEIGQVSLDTLFNYNYPFGKKEAAITHLHPIVETVWVQEGSYFDPEFVETVGEFKAGQVVQYPAHSIHTPSSDDGAVLFCHSRFPKFNARRLDQPEPNPFLQHLAEHGPEVEAVMGVPVGQLMEHYRHHEVKLPAKG